VPVDEWSVVPVPEQCFAADFNGDGKTDLACSNGTNGTWNMGLSTESGWTAQSWSGGPVVPLPMTQQCLSADLNGDGKRDLACWTGEGGGWGVGISTGSGWQGSIWSHYGTALINITSASYAGTSAVPEPGTWLMLGTGAGMLAFGWGVRLQVRS
jgi:hypothetical protein